MKTIALLALGALLVAADPQTGEKNPKQAVQKKEPLPAYRTAVNDATQAYVKALQKAQKQAVDAKDEKAAEEIGALIDEVEPPILGTWSWYGGTMNVKKDGTCHYKRGENYEEHGVWEKAPDYLFNWGEKGNDWNYLNVDEEGKLSGKFIRWGNELQGERPSE